jgi:hypothetical protein
VNTRLDAFADEMRALGKLPPEQARDELLRRIAAAEPEVKRLHDDAIAKSKAARSARAAHFDANFELRYLRHLLFRLAAYVAHRGTS